MKLITYSKIGYNSPRNANWCYEIFKIDYIDTDGHSYQASMVIRSQFGSMESLCSKMHEAGHRMIHTIDVYTETGTPKITGVRKMYDAMDNEVIDSIINWYK